MTLTKDQSHNPPTIKTRVENKRMEFGVENCQLKKSFVTIKEDSEKTKSAE